MLIERHPRGHDYGNEWIRISGNYSVQCGCLCYVTEIDYLKLVTDVFSTEKQARKYYPSIVPKLGLHPLQILVILI